MASSAMTQYGPRQQATISRAPGEQIQQLEASRAARGLADARDLLVDSHLEPLTTRGRISHIIKCLLEYSSFAPLCQSQARERAILIERTRHVRALAHHEARRPDGSSRAAPHDRAGRPRRWQEASRSWVRG
jgi:hypothetical protein